MFNLFVFAPFPEEPFESRQAPQDEGRKSEHDPLREDREKTNRSKGTSQT